MSGELPKGWSRTTLGGVADIALGKMLDRGKRAPGTPLRYLRNANVRWDGFDLGDLSEMPFEEDESDRYALRAGDLLICEGGEPGRAAVWTGSSRPIKYQKALLRVRPRDGVNARWIMYSLRNDAVAGALEEYFTGSTIKHFPQQAAVRYELPLPPVNEQRRIVGKLDAVLARVNAVRDRLTKVPAIVRRFRQSVLAAAYSGRLTADWRNENPADNRIDAVLEAIRQRRATGAGTNAQKEKLAEIFSTAEENDSDELPENWHFVALSKLCSSFDYGTSAKSLPSGKVPVLRMGNIQNGRLDWTDLVYTSDSDEIHAYSLRPNTVLFNRTNSPELVGKTAIYRGERPAIFAGYLIRINPLPELDPEYLNLCLNTNYAREFCARVKTDGVSQSNINAQKLGTFEVPFCSLVEQQEIVRRVVALFKLADKIDERYAKAQVSVGKVTASLLARAFRGELVATEAELAQKEGREYEPASAFLDRIQGKRADHDGARSVRADRTRISGPVASPLVPRRRKRKLSRATPRHTA